jgi:parallel beta-helix repeat protein
VHDNLVGIRVEPDDNTVGPGNDLFENTGWALEINGKTFVIGNRIHDNTDGVQLQGGADASIVTGNTLFRNPRAFSLGAQAEPIVIAHNTIVATTTYIITSPASTDQIDLRNNIVTGGGAEAIDQDDSQFDFRDHNLFFDNAGGICSFCSGPGPNSVEADPLYILAAADDYRLMPGSPAVDAGLDVGIDTNGPEADDFNGSAPDIGAWESPY